MRRIYKTQKGKDFYRDELEYLEYDATDYDDNKEKWYDYDDDVVSYKISYKFLLQQQTDNIKCLSIPESDEELYIDT